jgi:hypothetical protein
MVDLVLQDKTRQKRDCDQLPALSFSEGSAAVATEIQEGLVAQTPGDLLALGYQALPAVPG